MTQAMWGRGRTDSGIGTACRPSDVARSAANRSASASAPVVKALTPSSWAAPPSRSMLWAGCSTNRRGESPSAASGVAPETCPTHCVGGQLGRHLGDRAVRHGQQHDVGVGCRAGIALHARDVPAGGRAITNGMSGTAGSDEHDVHGGVVPLAKDGVLGGKRTILSPCPSTNISARPATPGSRSSSWSSMVVACPECTSTDLQKLLSTFQRTRVGGDMPVGRRPRAAGRWLLRRRLRLSLRTVRWNRSRTAWRAVSAAVSPACGAGDRGRVPAGRHGAADRRRALVSG